MPINFRHVSYIYSRKTPFEQAGLNDINLEVADSHSFVALIGHTGSGKSTLVQHLNGLLFPSTGEVEVDSFTVYPEKKKNKNIRSLRKYAGLVFQFPEYQLFEETVLKDVSFGPKNFGANEADAKNIAQKALLSVGLDESYFERSPFELSGGERRRVAIAGIIALEPKILVLDEPTAGLDPQGVQEMMHLFQKIHAAGTRIILVTHEMDLVLEYCDYAIVMKDGRIVKETTPLELFTKEDTNDLSLEIPLVFALAHELQARGLAVNLEKVRNIDTLAQQIKEARDA